MISLDQNYDVCVVGAGVFGVWTALLLRRSGRRVLLLDQYGPGNSRSSSGGESRIIRMGYGADEIYTRSAQNSLQKWKELETLSKESLFIPTGVLWLAHEHDPYVLQSAETLTRTGIDFEKLTKTELQQRYPQIAADDIEWAMLEPASGALMARRAVQAVARVAVTEGVAYLQTSVLQSVTNFTVADGRTIHADQFVFACGPWLPKVFPDVIAQRITPSRQEVFFFGAQNSAAYSSPQLPVWIDFTCEAYGFPDLEGRGVKVAIDRHGETFDVDNEDRLASAAGLSEVRSYLQRRLPSLSNAPVVETRVCQYENTSTGDFLIDQHPDHANVWLVGGGSGHGFKHGPSVAEYVVNRIDGKTKDIEPRFSLLSKQTKQQRAVY